MNEQPRQQLSLVNLAMPFVMLAGAIFGYQFGHHYGLGWAIVGAIGGGILSIPAFGVCLLPIIGIAWLLDRAQKPKA